MNNSALYITKIFNIFVARLKTIEQMKTTSLRFLVIFFLVTGFCTISSAQKFSVGLQAGVSFYDGDLSQPEFIKNLSFSRPAIGALIRYEIVKPLSVRAGVIKGQVRANDTKSTLNWQHERGIYFQSDILEFNLIVEFEPLKLFNENYDFPISPYLFIGASYFKFNPQSYYNGRLVDLQPLGTEGQGMPGYPDNTKYELQSLALPFGFGLRATWGNFIIDLEYGTRKTGTDYLDDTSAEYVSFEELLEHNGIVAATLGNKINAGTGDKRGGETVWDWYTIPAITFGYKVNLGTTFKDKKSADCPTF